METYTIDTEHGPATYWWQWTDDSRQTGAWTLRWTGSDGHQHETALAHPGAEHPLRRPDGLSGLSGDCSGSGEGGCEPWGCTGTIREWTRDQTWAHRQCRHECHGAAAAARYLGSLGIGAGDKITTTQAANIFGIRTSSWRTMVARGRMPASDGHWDARTPWWWMSTVLHAQAQRPGQGARTDLRTSASLRRQIEAATDQRRSSRATPHPWAGRLIDAMHAIAQLHPDETTRRDAADLAAQCDQLSGRIAAGSDVAPEMRQVIDLMRQLADEVGSRDST